jgi:hypothetical protein
MATVNFNLSLPENLRKEAEKAGLLTPKALEKLLRDEIRRRRVDGLFTAADKLASLDMPVLSDAEVEAEIQKARKPTVE